MRTDGLSMSIDMIKRWYGGRKDRFRKHLYNLAGLYITNSLTQGNDIAPIQTAPIL